MADTIMYCGHCKEDTEHTHLAGRTCACAVCGELSQAKQIKRILANIEERKAGNMAAVAKAMGKIEADPELQAVAQLPYSERGFREPSGKQRKIKGENTMKKLTEENIADIIRRKAAGEKPADMAAEFGVNRCSIYAVLSKSGGKKVKKATGTKKGNGANQERPGQLPEPAPTQSPGNPLSDAIARQVSGQLADLDRRIDSKVREILAEMLK